MVKNAKGGNKSKGFARKFISSPQNTSLRLPQDPLEQFAIVHKIYGTICDVMMLDQTMIKCHIRGKFRGRSKRNSMITVGKLILMGFRDFESPPYKNSDLLEIYDSNDILQLSLSPHLHISSLLSIYQSLHINTPHSHTPHSPIDLDIDHLISFSHTTISTPSHTTISTTTPYNTLHDSTTDSILHDI